MFMQIYFNAVKSSYIVYHNIQAIKTEKSYAYSRINYNKFKHKLNIRCYRYINIYLNMKKKKKTDQLNSNPQHFKVFIC